MKNMDMRTLLALMVMSSIIVLKVPGQSTRPEPPTGLRIEIASAQPAAIVTAPMVVAPEPIHPVVPTNAAPIQPVMPTNAVPIGTGPVPHPASTASTQQKD